MATRQPHWLSFSSQGDSFISCRRLIGQPPLQALGTFANIINIRDKWTSTNHTRPTESPRRKRRKRPAKSMQRVTMTRFDLLLSENIILTLVCRHLQSVRADERKSKQGEMQKRTRQGCTSHSSTELQMRNLLQSLSP